MASINPSTWMNCAGKLPFNANLDSQVLYYCQGHAEAYGKSAEFRLDVNVRSKNVAILCKIVGIRYLADKDSEEMLAEIELKRVLADEDEDRIPVPPFVLLQDQRDGFFMRDLYQSHVLDRLQIPAANNGVFTHLTSDSTVTLLDVAGKQFSVKYQPAKSGHNLAGAGWKDIVSEKGLLAGDTIIFNKTEQGISFFLKRKDNVAAQEFTKSPESHIDKIKEAFRRAKSKKSQETFKVTFFPGWVNFLVDPNYLELCNQKVKVMEAGGDRRANRVRSLNNPKQKGRMIVPDEDFKEISWKNTTVRWDWEGSTTKVNSFDIETVALD